MGIKIVTDSASDIPADVAKELGITIVPLYVQFGGVAHRDGIDIQPAQVFERLEKGENLTTSASSPGDFAEAYSRLCLDSDGIISVHISRKLSATYDSALAGRELVTDKKCHIEVVDSTSVSMGTGLITMAAARAAMAGKNMQAIMDNMSQMIHAISAYGLLDTLKYIGKSGRLGKAGPILGSVLPIKPLLEIKDGAITPIGAVRARNKGIDRLLELVKATHSVQEIGIAHSARAGEVESFVERLKSMLPNIRPTVSSLGPALGVHGGPGTLIVAMQRDMTGVEAKEKKPGMSMPSLQSIREGLAQRMQKDNPQPFAYQFETIT